MHELSLKMEEEEKKVTRWVWKRARKVKAKRTTVRSGRWGLSRATEGFAIGAEGSGTDKLIEEEEEEEFILGDFKVIFYGCV